MKNSTSRNPGLFTMAILIGAALCMSVADAARHESSVRMRLKLEYPAALAGAGFNDAMVRLSLGRQSAWFIVDTGAAAHMLAKWFADSSGSAGTQQGQTFAADSTGKLASMPVARHLRMGADEHVMLELEAAAVAAFPPVFHDNGLGGLLSPQSIMHADEAVTIDFRHGSMWVESPGSALARLKSTGLSPIQTTRACREESGNIGSQLYTVPATVNGIPVSLLLDSGAEKTQIQPLATAAKLLHPDAPAGSHVIGANGVAQATSQVTGASITFAGHVRQTDMTIGGAHSSCGPDGLAGMDLLRSCVVVLGRDTASYACEATGQGKPAQGIEDH